MKLNSEAWSHDTDGIVVLLSSVCGDCGKQNFPPLRYCPNCHSENLNKKEIRPTGTLYSFSRVHVNHKRYPAPYIVGYVDFPEGPRVFGQVRAEIDEVYIGMKVTLLSCSFGDADAAVEAYCFVPEVKE